ncbi:MAG: 50S ribosomal protein L29 [Candidatus Pacearchaeota archaeon]|nr:50S ribosomal protein L29 [Candidatus Pacearchaeota archaeon]
MAIIRSKELRSMRKEEILEKLRQLEIEILKIKSKKGQSQGKKIKEIKKTIARMHSILKEK